MKERNKMIDDIRACLYELYNEFVDATKEQSSIGLSELMYDFGIHTNLNSVCTEKVKFDIDFI